MLPGCYNRNVGNKAMQAVQENSATKVLQEVLQLENKAVAAEPAVALEALPPATFDCIGLHHKEEQGGEIPKKTYFHQLHTGRSREENRRKNIFH